MNDYIIINDNDNVLVTLRPFVKGEIVNGITLLNDVPQAHKVALVDIKENEDIIKYADEKKKELVEAIEKCDFLPEVVDYEKVNELLINIRKY